MSEQLTQITVLSPEAVEAVQSKIERYGGIEYFEAEFGLGEAELLQPVTFGSYEGAFVDALVPDDPADLNNPSAKPCPVGGIVKEAFQQGGIQEVQTKLDGLSMLDKRFSLRISDTAVAREVARSVVKKKILGQPNVT